MTNYLQRIHFIKDLAELPLVALRTVDWEKALFITISPNPNVKCKVYRIDGNKIKLKVFPYKLLTHLEQYEYLLNIVRKVYIFSEGTMFFCTWELNEQNNMHFHLLYHDSHVCNNKITLKHFQNQVKTDPIILKNMSRKMIDYMNNIVFVNDTINDRIEYLLKDSHDAQWILPTLPYFTFNVPLE